MVATALGGAAGAVVAVFLVFSVPRHLTFDPALSRMPPVDGFPAHCPLLVAHVVFASAAMVTGFFQVWPWFRGRFRAAHRRMGRVYVFAGVAHRSGDRGGLAVRSGDESQHRAARPAVAGFHRHRVPPRPAGQARRAPGVDGAQRDPDQVDHPQPAGHPVAVLVLRPHLDTAFGGSEIALLRAVGALSARLGWVLPLLVVEWWLQRGSRTAQPGTRRTSRV